MGAVALDFSKAQPLPGTGVKLDFSQAKPIEAPKEGFFHSLAAQFGITPEQIQGEQDDRNAHPAKSLLKDLAGPAGTILEGLYNQGKVTVSEIKAAHDASVGGNRWEGLHHLVEAVPIVGSAINKAADQAPATTGNYAKDVANVATDPGAMGTLVGAAANAAPLVAGAIDKVFPNRPGIDNPPIDRIPKAFDKAKQGFRRGAYPDNVSIPAQEAAAQKFIKAMVPDTAAIPNIKSAVSELPDALADAANKGKPINGKLDAAQALRDRADDIQAHYDDKILRPHVGEVNQVPENYSGDTSGGPGKATLGQINERVNDINAELKSNFRKKVASQTTEANASDADLITEKNALSDILHQRLADLNGLKPFDIADVRRRAGKLRSLAQEVEISADRDTVAQGRRDSSGGPLSIKNPVEGVVQHVGGGQEIIGNRNFRRVLGEFPSADKPLPQPAPPGPNVATTPEMAQREFLRQHQLEQAAQDAAAGRSQAVQTYRAEQATGQQGIAQQEFLRSQDLEQEAQTAAQSRSTLADRARQGFIEKQQGIAKTETTGAVNIEQAAQDSSAARAEIARNERARRAPTRWTEAGASKMTEHIGIDPSSGLKAADIARLQTTSQGRQLLVRASGIQPGSAMMKNMVARANAILGANN